MVRVISVSEDIVEVFLPLVVHHVVADPSDDHLASMGRLRELRCGSCRGVGCVVVGSAKVARVRDERGGKGRVVSPGLGGISGRYRVLRPDDLRLVLKVLYLDRPGLEAFLSFDAWAFAVSPGSS